MRGVKDARPFTLEPGRAVELEFDHQSRADQAEMVPGVFRSGDGANGRYVTPPQTP